MLLLDVNVLVHAHRTAAPEHARYRTWLESLASSDLAFSAPSQVLSGFLRIVTHPRVFNPPSRIGDALQFAEQLRQQPNYVDVVPGPRHWSIFTSLCRTGNAKGNLVPDAYLAALAIEVGGEWITTDRDYARFPGLSWRHPFDKK